MDNLESSNQIEAATVGSQSTIINIPDELQAERIQLYQAALKGDWKKAQAVIRNRSNIVRETITRNFETVLHIAVAAKRKGFVRNLLGEMNDNKDLAMRNNDGNTSLYFAAASGVVEIAKMLIERNTDLPNIPGSGGMTPIHIAALFRHEEMVTYLCEKTNFRRIDVAYLRDLFFAIISADIFDVALLMLTKSERKNELLKPSVYSDSQQTALSNKQTALHLMARKADAISDKSELNFFHEKANSWFKGFFFREAKMRTSANELVTKLWESVVQLPEKEVSDFIRSPSRLIFDAAESGNVEFLVIIIRSYPDLIWKVDDNGRSIFHIAVLNRHESIFTLIYELGGIKDLLASYKVDKTKDNLLHLVARLPPPNRLHLVSGAALQMRRELLWFEAVKEIVPRSYIKTKNQNGDVAHDIFTKEHTALQKEGERWMKETATACMVVATLIATMIFAAAFALPGGNEDSEVVGISGFPKFRKKLWFDIFIISDAISLLTSVASIVIFLSILTSRYAEDDFRKALPRKLISGLFALFISIISMIIAFTATMILIRDKEAMWSLIIIISLALFAGILFAWLHFQVWFDTLLSAYSSRFLFSRSYKRRLFL